MNLDVVNNSTYDPNEFLKDMVLYGEIIKGRGNHPEQDRELVCVFDASGKIYLDPNDENVVYLWITTDWLEDGVIAFDRVNLSEQKRLFKKITLQVTIDFIFAGSILLNLKQMYIVELGINLA